MGAFPTPEESKQPIRGHITFASSQIGHFGQKEAPEVPKQHESNHNVRKSNRPLKHTEINRHEPHGEAEKLIIPENHQIAALETESSLGGSSIIAKETGHQHNNKKFIENIKYSKFPSSGVTKRNTQLRIPLTRTNINAEISPVSPHQGHPNYQQHEENNSIPKRNRKTS